MSEIVDARGLSCPEPVMLTKKALQSTKEQEATVLVSSSVAKDNVSRMVKKSGWEVTNVEPDGDGFKLTVVKS